MKVKQVLNIILLVFVLIGIHGGNPTRAGSIEVTTIVDIIDAAATCAQITIESLPGPDRVTSLREAMCAANNNDGPDTIAFAIPLCGDVCVIKPLVALPVLTDDDTTINGYSQGGASPATETTPAVLRIEIDGSEIALNSGFNITSSGNVIRGLVINRFSLNGISIGDIYGTGASGNTILGNFIGTDSTGTVASANALNGVFIGIGAQGNTIGGSQPADRNIISGNTLAGIDIHGTATISNTITGNYIGTNTTGHVVLSNRTHGVRIYGGASGNIVGPGNFLSTNILDGVKISGLNTSGNLVIGNAIGLGADGTTILGNGNNGIFLAGGANGNTIGGTASTQGNIIVTNQGAGVRLDEGASGNTILGNLIGLTADGVMGYGNGYHGVFITGASDNNTVGPGNVISANGRSGVEINSATRAITWSGEAHPTGMTATGNVVIGNYIGTDQSGSLARGNDGDGITIWDGAQNTIIGGDSEAERNVISGNESDGIFINGEGTSGIIISGNYIGLAANGSDPMGNNEVGVRIGDGAQDVTIGGDSPGERNVISANNESGINLNAVGTMSITISGNYIGTDASGLIDLGNNSDGVELENGVHDVLIGGATAAEGNLISGNSRSGIEICCPGTRDVVVTANKIGTDRTGFAALGNDSYGIDINGGAQDTAIGGLNAGEENFISANLVGIRIRGADTSGHLIRGNYIGLAADGRTPLGNTLDGVHLSEGAHGNFIDSNYISYNYDDGVQVDTPTTYDNHIIGNSIHSNVMEGIKLTNGAHRGIFPPEIESTGVGSVVISGTACPDCWVEVFENRDDDGEGERDIGLVRTDLDGNFTLTVDHLTYVYLTATATEEDDGTSEFSAVYTATYLGVRDIYLPLIFIGE